MDTPIFYLDESEEKAVRGYAQGLNHRAVFNESQPFCGPWTFAAEIKRKTGIPSMTSPLDCLKFLTRYTAALNPPLPLSVEQNRVVRLFMERNLWDAIGYHFQMTGEATEAFFNETLRQMGIFTKDERAQRYQIQLYQSIFQPSESFSNVLDMKEEAMLRKWAEGWEYRQIADLWKLDWKGVRETIKDAAHKIGLMARGRNTQKSLVQLFYRWQDAREAAQPAQPVTMDDPAFQ